MPFRSSAQERYMWAAHPDIARRWVKKYGSILHRKSKKTSKEYGFKASLAAGTQKRFPKGSKKGGQFAPKNSGIPVSRAVEFRKSIFHAGTNKAAVEAIKAVDRVHTDGKLPKIQVISGIPYHLQAARGAFNTQTNKIYLNPTNTTPALTAAHEMGHALSYRALPNKRMSASAGRIMKAIDNSPTTKAWYGYERTNMVKLSNGQHVGISPAYFKYFNSREEQWARAYAQYITVRSRHPLLRQNLQYHQRSTLRTQWDDKEFEPIAKEFDRYFASLGWR